MHPRRRPLDFARLREMITPKTALQLLGWRPTYGWGERWRGPCPLHGPIDKKSRSLRGTPTVAYCGRCQWGGDAVAFWARYHRLPTLEAAYDLCERLGIDPPFLTR